MGEWFIPAVLKTAVLRGTDGSNPSTSAKINLIMNSKGHLIVSLVKSSLRIGGCIISLINASLEVLCLSFLAAELLGIIEELLDKR